MAVLIDSSSVEFAVIKSVGTKQENSITDIRILSLTGTIVEDVDYQYPNNLPSQLLDLNYDNNLHLFLSPITIGQQEALNDRTTHLAWIDMSGRVVREIELEQEVATITYYASGDKYISVVDNQLLVFDSNGHLIDQKALDIPVTEVSTYDQNKIFLRTYDDHSAGLQDAININVVSFYLIVIMTIVIIRKLIIRSNYK